MLKELITSLLGKRIIVSSAPGAGASSFTLYIANTILDNNKLVLYYNPDRDIDREFVKKYYPRVFSDAVWLTSTLEDFLELYAEHSQLFDTLIVDPGDITMVDKHILPTLGCVRRPGATLICTSQIRQDPNKAWAPYSTLEALNSFDYSIWITKVTGIHPVFIQKYIDVHDKIRSGQNLILRDIANYTLEGNIVQA